MKNNYYRNDDGTINLSTYRFLSRGDSRRTENNLPLPRDGANVVTLPVRNKAAVVKNVLTDNYNLEDFIELEDTPLHKIIVSKYRLGMSSEVEKADISLGLTLQNTATEQTSGRQYIGRINWNQGLSLNLSLGSFTLSPRSFEDFLVLLKSGRAVDGTGRQISQAELLQIYKEITEVREPYRAEWLDADFKVVGSGLNINYNHRIVKGKLQPENSESLENYLMENCYIDLASANKQGLPTRKLKNQEIYYRCPIRDNNSVAKFGAFSGWASLDCYRSAADSDAMLGVRRAILLPKLRK